MMTQQTADLPAIFQTDVIPLDAEIAALETLRQGLDGAIIQMLADEAHHRAERDRLTAVEREPKTLDFLHGGDWHQAHADWERREIERTGRLAQVTEARDRAFGVYRDFVEWIVGPVQARLDHLRSNRAEIVDARMGLCDAAMKAAWRGGMGKAA